MFFINLRSFLSLSFSRITIHNDHFFDLVILRQKVTVERGRGEKERLTKAHLELRMVPVCKLVPMSSILLTMLVFSMFLFTSFEFLGTLDPSSLYFILGLLQKLELFILGVWYRNAILLCLETEFVIWFLLYHLTDSITMFVLECLIHVVQVSSIWLNETQSIHVSQWESEFQYQTLCTVFLTVNS